MTLDGRARLAIAAALLAAFAAIAHALPATGGMRADVTVANWMLAHVTERGAVVATWVSWLGDTALSGLLATAVVLLFLHRYPASAVTVALTTIGGMLLVTWLKPIFHRPRPDYAVELLAGSSWSFPSGHSMASIVGYGIVAYFRIGLERRRWRRRVIFATVCLMILLVGYSRLYLGVHYFSDVIGGFVAGALWLLACIEVHRLVAAHRASR